MIGIVRTTEGKISAKMVIAGNTEDRELVEGEEQYDLEQPDQLEDFNAVQIHDQYKTERALAYPPITDGLDALVHKENGDEAAWSAYVERCNAVKAQFPKPEGDPQ